jgi:GR25 family glycosyltransferase involved in LPS biosynthesis
MTVPVYYINLDRHPERAAQVKKSFQSASKLVRVPALDASQHSEQTLVASFGGPRGVLPVSSTADDPDPSLPHAERVGRLGSIGCTVSHLRALAAAYRAGETHAVILEDDQPNDFESRWVDASISDFISRLPADWRIVNLGAFFPEEDAAFEGVDPATGEPTPKAAWVAAWAAAGRPAAMARPNHASRDPRLAGVPGGVPEHWGSSALLVNRAGMKALMDTYRRHDGKPGFDLSKARCTEYDTCVAGEPFRNGGSGGGGGFYEATPPLFVQRATGTVASDLDHGNGDVLRKFGSFTRQWLDIARGGGPDPCLGLEEVDAASESSEEPEEFRFAFLDALKGAPAAPVLRLAALGEGEFAESFAASLRGAAPPIHTEKTPAPAPAAAGAVDPSQPQKTKVELEDEADEKAEKEKEEEGEEEQEEQQQEEEEESDVSRLGTFKKPTTLTSKTTASKSSKPSPHAASSKSSSSSSYTKHSSKVAANANAKAEAQEEDKEEDEEEEVVPKAGKKRPAATATAKTTSDTKKATVGKKVKHVEEEEAEEVVVKTAAKHKMSAKAAAAAAAAEEEEEEEEVVVAKAGKHAPKASSVKVTKKKAAVKEVEEEEEEEEVVAKAGKHAPKASSVKAKVTKKKAAAREEEEEEEVVSKAGKATKATKKVVKIQDEHAAKIEALKAALEKEEEAAEEEDGVEEEEEEEEYEEEVVAAKVGKLGKLGKQAAASKASKPAAAPARHGKVSAEEARAFQGLSKAFSAAKVKDAALSPAHRSPSVAPSKAVLGRTVRKAVTAHSIRAAVEEEEEEVFGAVEYEEEEEEEEEEEIPTRAASKSHKTAVPARKTVATTAHKTAAAAAHPKTVSRKVAPAGSRRPKLAALGDSAGGWGLGFSLPSFPLAALGSASYSSVKVGGTGKATNRPGGTTKSANAMHQKGDGGAGAAGAGAGGDAGTAQEGKPEPAALGADAEMDAAMAAMDQAQATLLFSDPFGFASSDPRTLAAAAGVAVVAAVAAVAAVAGAVRRRRITGGASSEEGAALLIPTTAAAATQVTAV